MQSETARTLKEPRWYKQFPYSNLKQNAYSLGYAWKPEGNRWIDLNAGIWLTKSDNQRHQNGDAIFGLGYFNGEFPDRNWSNYVRCRVAQDETIHTIPGYCDGVPDTPPDKKIDPEGRYIIQPRALQIADHDRFGFSLSNKFRLHPTLDLTIAGDFIREKLEQWNASEVVGSDHTENTFGIHYYAPPSR